MPVAETFKVDPSLKPITIGTSDKPQLPLGFGGSWYVPYSSPGEQDADLLAAMQVAYDRGVRHFDTAARYGGGHSEELYGSFIRSRRDRIFLCSKSDTPEMTAAAMLAQVDGSLKRLQTDMIDLYYIHWPKTGQDMRPTMEGLEQARRQGKIRCVGVSNFSAPQMRQVQEVGRIDAHQLGYNLLWRYVEAEVLPHCRQHGIAVVTYSSLAHGILTGKFARDPGLREGDQRHRILPFRADIWPHVYAGVEKLKAIAAEIGRPLAHLAVRWVMSRPAVSVVVVGARNAGQADHNTAALADVIPPGVFERMTAVSDEIVRHVPDEGNLFGRKG